MSRREQKQQAGNDLGRPSAARILFAVLIGLVGFAVYIIAAISLADPAIRAGWIAQVVYFILAGVLWVIPARALIVWTVRPYRSRAASQ